MKLFLSCGSAIAVVLGVPATAQVTTLPQATTPDVVSTDTDQPGVGDVIVTGEKVNRTLQDTPASVAVTTNQAITDQNLVSVYDVLERTPNLSPNGNRTSFSIRGIDAFNVSGGGDGALASVYLDGAVLPQPAIAAGPLDLYDIAQVEVFRGPQSTVQGRNALAGAVIIRTTDPGYDWSGRARAQLYDKTGERRFAAALGGPVIEDQVAFRVAGEVARADGLLYNVTRAEDADRRRSETVRGKLLVTPAALPGLRIVATYLHDRHLRGAYNIELGPPFRPTDRIATGDVADTTEVKSDIGTLEIGYDLATGISLSSVTNYSDIRSVQLFDPDRSPVTGADSRVDDPSKTFQQELRLNVDRSWVKGLIGAYYLRDDNRDNFFQANQVLQLRRLGVDQALLGLGLPLPVVNTVLNLYGGNGTVAISNSLAQPRLTNNYAGFADLTFPVSDRLRLIAGLRYDHESQDRGAVQAVVLARPLPAPGSVPPALAPIVTQLNGLLNQTVANANSTTPVRKVTYDAWLPKAGLTYDVAADVSLSLTAQRGYRAGGAGINQQRGEYYEYDPEYTWNYEAALRSQFFDRRLTVNANAFYIDWRDQQVSVQLTPGAVFDSQTVNAGKSRLYGAEVSLAAQPTRTLSFYGAAGYTDTKFTDFDVTVGQTALGAADGNEFANAPHWTLSGATTWEHPSGVFVNVNARHRSAFFRDTIDQARREIRGITLVNAKVGWQNEHFGAYLIASNIFDVEKPLTSFLDFDGRTRGTLSEPRIIGLSFEGRF